jgi:c-di-GMP-binding flagellar brake protein YcgR
MLSCASGKGNLMLERRNSDRLGIRLSVREANGDYFFTYLSLNLSEEGIFLESRQCVSSQEPFSKLNFTLPGGKQLRNITARIVREERKGSKKGCAYEFLNLNEAQRMDLKKFFHQHLLKGTG